MVVYMYSYNDLFFIVVCIMCMAIYMAIYTYGVSMAIYIHWLFIGYVLVMYWLPILVSYCYMYIGVYMY